MEFSDEDRRRSLKELETEIESKKKDVLERISFQIELKNLDETHHVGVDFEVECLFASTEDLDNCFSLGKTKVKKMMKDQGNNNSDAYYIIFDEEFEFNFLFERTQYLRIMIHTSDEKCSEIRIKLAKVITSKLADLTVPINLLKQEVVEFTGNSFNRYTPYVNLHFQRKTPSLDKKLSSFYVEFNYVFASQVVHRLVYEIISIKRDESTSVLYRSNELIGKSPLFFSAATFEDKSILTDPDIMTYVFEFYDNEYYLGQTYLERHQMELLMDTSNLSAFSSSVSFEYAQLNPNEHNKARLSTKNSTGHNYTSYGSRDSRDSRDSPTRGRVSPTKGYKENGNQFGSSEKTLKQVNSLSGRSIYDIETKDSNETPTKKVGYSNKNTVVVKPDFSTVLGKISITYRENTKQKFYNLFSGGLRIACDIAVDYTSSNLDPSLENSLHTLKLENNHYAKAIKSCGNILKDYDDDQQFPLYGFGGVPENGKEVSHCFNVNNKRSPIIKGMDNVIQTYVDSLKQVQLVGPTYFTPILKTVVESIKKEMKGLKPKDPLIYHVCLLLTDGKIDDMNETQEMLIEAAKLPMSVIIVGVGSADFGKMVTLGNIIVYLI